MYKTSILGARKIISLALSLLLIIPNITSAAPFDIFDKYYPDFLISNIWQDNSSKDIYVKVCNTWWSADSGTMQLWLKKSNWEKFTKTFQNVNIYNWGCVDYRAFSPSDISIGSSGNYSLTVWIIIKSSKSEKNLANNISTRYVYINAPIPYFNTNYNYQNFNSNYYYNDYNSNYNRNIDITYPAGWETFSNNSSNYINLRARVYANSRDISYINTYFFRQSTGEQYKYDRIDNINYRYGSSNPFDINKTFYIDNWPAGDYYIKMEAYNIYGNIIATDATRSFRINDNYYNNNYYYDQNYYNNNCSYYNYNCGRSDLVVDNITQNTNYKTLTVKICNRWNSTLSNQNWSTRIYNNSNWSSVVRNHSINLWQNSCIDFNVSYYEIWISYNNYWFYEIKAETDIYNNIYESNEDNNSYIRGFNY